MRLVIVRHADAAPGRPDELRPLTPAGRENARALGERLAAEERVDAVVASPLLRARETAEVLARRLGVEHQVDERLAPGATADDFRAAADGRGDVVIAVGHQPDCGLAAAALGGGSPPPFPPASALAFEVER